MRLSVMLSNGSSWGLFPHSRTSGVGVAVGANRPNRSLSRAETDFSEFRVDCRHSGQNPPVSLTLVVRPAAKSGRVRMAGNAFF